ncbi:uncharacterized protein LOC131877370 [Tigriopus californicus]|uniref:uncharacterized protein LOC131877370 n=1 Tax=Tigriopus californicus TaxID=6832 RepID=UPI0027DA75A7|nr:uncharacterized protein LOC131877370 [Tigriopus californicus]
MGIKTFFAIVCICMIRLGSSFKTGFESGLICYQCVGTHPGCGLHDFDWRWYWGKICPRSDDRCVKLIERKGSNVVVTRDCLSNLEGFRTDIPADKYEGCRAKSKDVKLGQYTFNRIKELDTKRNFYDNTTWCFCDFDHWCNASNPTSKSNPVLMFGFLLSGFALSSVLAKWS